MSAMSESEFEIKDIEIGLGVFGRAGFRDRHDAILLQQPAQCHLCRGFAIGLADGNQRFIIHHLGTRQRAIGGQQHVMAAEAFKHLGLVKIGVIFDLIDGKGKIAVADGAFDQGGREVGNPDQVRHAEVFDLV